MHQVFFIKVQLIKNLSLIKKKKFVVTHRYEKDKGLYLYRVQTVESG